MLAAIACVAVTMAWVAEVPAVVATGVSLLLLLPAALVDAVEHRLPNTLVGAAAIPVLLAMLVAPVAGSTGTASGALAGAALVGGLLLVTHLVAPAGMGFGDVKAGVVLGAAVGLVSVQVAVLALVLALAGAAGWAVARRRRAIPLGPGLVAGGIVALAVARWIGVS